MRLIEEGAHKLATTDRDPPEHPIEIAGIATLGT